MVEMIRKIEKLSFKDQQDSPYFADLRTVITPTVISGGVGPSIVPDICEAHIDIRLVPSTPREVIEHAIEKIRGEVQQQRPSLQVELASETYLPPTIIPEDAEVLSALRASVQEVLQIDPIMQVSGPANESYLLNGYGIPTCTYGPDGAGAHAANEFIVIDSIFQVAQVYAQTVLKMRT